MHWSWPRQHSDCPDLRQSATTQAVQKLPLLGYSDLWNKTHKDQEGKEGRKERKGGRKEVGKEGRKERRTEGRR